jgi:hypothetical protein
MIKYRLRKRGDAPMVPIVGTLSGRKVQTAESTVANEQ